MTDRPTEARHPAAEGLHALTGEEVLRHLLDGQAAAVAAAGVARISHGPFPYLSMMSQLTEAARAAID